MNDDNQTPDDGAQSAGIATAGETPQANAHPGTTQQHTKASDAKAETPRPASFDQWLNAADDYTKALITGHITGLKSALESERTERKTVAKQLKDLTAKADEGTELRAQLDRLNADFETVNRRAAFYESAPADLTNVRLAYLAAQDCGAVGADGKVDWAKLKAQAPELFKRQPPPPGNAGSGAQQTGQTDRSMNAFIRAAAGKGQ